MNLLKDISLALLIGAVATLLGSMVLDAFNVSMYLLENSSEVF